MFLGSSEILYCSLVCAEGGISRCLVGERAWGFGGSKAHSSVVEAARFTAQGGNVGEVVVER